MFTSSSEWDSNLKRCVLHISEDVDNYGWQCLSFIDSHFFKHDVFLSILYIARDCLYLYWYLHKYWQVWMAVLIIHLWTLTLNPTEYFAQRKSLFTIRFLFSMKLYFLWLQILKYLQCISPFYHPHSDLCNVIRPYFTIDIHSIPRQLTNITY